MSFNPTPSQQQVLDDNSQNLLVSASAGSGKTATIIQKILNLISLENKDIQKFLVITFTESASLEMKSRLKESLFQLEKTKNNLEQIDKLSTSDISTIHGFCSKMIRKYFFKLDLNPNFVVLDDTNAKFLKADAIEKALQTFAQDQNFIILSQYFGGGRNFLSLKENILKLHDFLCSLDDPSDFKKNLSKSLYEENLSKNPACEILNKQVLSTTFYISSLLDDFLIKANLQNENDFVIFINTLKVLFSEISYNKTFLKNRETILNLTFPHFPTKKKNEIESEFRLEFKTFFNDAKSLVNDLKELVINSPLEEIKCDLKNASNLIDKVLEVLDEFVKEYVALKQKRNALDFNDLEEKFLELLNFEEVKNAIAQSYEYIFVDEYQDINSVQEKIIKKICSCNLIMVGDVKQSIYGFRNSSPAIFIEKTKRYNETCDGNLINLNENFRSNPEILDFINEIFNKCMTIDFGGVDYENNSKLCGKTKYEKSNIKTIKLALINTKTQDDGTEENIFATHEKLNENATSGGANKIDITKNITTSNNATNSLVINGTEKEINKDGEESQKLESHKNPYSVLDDNNDYESLTKNKKEGLIIAREIKNLIGQNYYDAKAGTFKKVTFGDIAILSRNNEFLKQIAEILLEYKIPISLNFANNFYDSVEVNILLSLLKIINNPHDDIGLSVAMTSFVGNFSFDEIASIRKTFKEEEFFYESVYKYLHFGKVDNIESVGIENTNLIATEIETAKLENVGIKKETTENSQKTKTLKSAKNETNIVEKVNIAKSPKNIDKFLQQKLEIFFDKINSLKQKLVYMSIYDLLNYLEKEYDYLTYFKSLPDGENRYKIVKNYIESFNGAEYNFDLVKYLNYVESFAKNTTFNSSLSESLDSVKLVTIHASKGLEYPIVFLVGTGNSFSTSTFKEEILKDKTHGLGLYAFNTIDFEKKPTLGRNAIKILLKNKEKSEELRLLYVALTRAKNNLIITGQADLENIKKITRPEEAKNVNSFLTWILSSLSDLAFEALISNKKTFVDKQKNFDINIEVFNDADFKLDTTQTRQLAIKLANKKEIENFLNAFDYNFEKSTNIALKNTVSSMLQEHTDATASLNFEPKKLEVSEHKPDIDYANLGTIYHKIMKKIDFKNISSNADANYNYIEEITKKLKLEKVYEEKIDIAKILKCAEKIKSLNAKSYNKEQPFLSFLPYNFIFKNSDIKDKILIQGVADLILDTDSGKILIDYKITKAKTKEELAKKYALQLSLYKICLEKALNSKIEKTYLYSFAFNDFVEIT